MAVKYQYLTDPLLGYQTKSGSLNTAGIIRVYDAATDDPVVTYKDFAGTANAQDIRLDDNGRAVIIADDSRAYRVEVCDRYGALLYTQTPLYAKGGGGGVMTGVNVISSDETVKVETTTEGGIKIVGEIVSLNRMEKAPDEEASIGLILCAEKPSKPQSTLNRWFTGEIAYEVNPLWETPIEVYPDKKTARATNKPGYLFLSSDGVSLPTKWIVGGEYIIEILESKEKVKIKII